MSQILVILSLASIYIYIQLLIIFKNLTLDATFLFFISLIIVVEQVFYTKSFVRKQ